MGLEPEQRIFQEEKKMAEEYIRGVFRKLGKTNQTTLRLYLTLAGRANINQTAPNKSLSKY